MLDLLKNNTANNIPITLIQIINPTAGRKISIALTNAFRSRKWYNIDIVITKII